jgi:type IV fimbrial biogenesis protein FimT
MQIKNGYSLFELLITIAILAALLFIAIPGWQAMMAQSRTTVVVNQLREAIYLARSEAQKRGMTVTFCKSADKATCSGTWADGQIIFLDGNNNGQVRSPKDIVRVFDRLSAGSSLVWKGRIGSENYLQIKSSTVTEVPNGSFFYCPADRNSVYARRIWVSGTGRIHVEKAPCN